MRRQVHAGDAGKVELKRGKNPTLEQPAREIAKARHDEMQLWQSKRIDKKRIFEVVLGLRATITMLGELAGHIFRP